jgi:hypothetical protein
MRAEFPIRFPNEADEIYREVQKFRQLSPGERLTAVIRHMASSDHLLSASPRRETALAQREADEAEWRRIQRELFGRHGH